MKEIVPNPTQMRRYVERGLTQQQIADEYEKDTGIRCTRQAIGMALARYDMKTVRPRKRHTELLPWVIRREHAMANDARMLRMEGRRRLGEQLREKDLRILEGWMMRLDEQDAVVHYDPDTEKGFWWVPRKPEDGRGLIRKPRPDDDEDAA